MKNQKNRVLHNNKAHKAYISDVELLHLADRVVKRYAYTIPNKEMEDIKMSLVEEFLMKKEKINSGFLGHSKATTYYMAVLNRMCCSIIRKEIKRWKNNSDAEVDIYDNHTNHDFTINRLVINQEVNLLRDTFTIIDDNCKTQIAFTTSLYLEPVIEHLSKYDKQYKKNKLESLLSPKLINTKSKAFDALASMINLVEKKDLKGDAVRMWMNKQYDYILNKMNGRTSRSLHNRESIQALFEIYHEKK